MEMRKSELPMKRVTIRDVAALAGVSSATVSRALNDHPAISPETKQLVREACRTLRYVPDITARGLSGHRTYTIGVIIPDISNPHFSALCTSIEGCAAEKGYRVLLTNTLYDPAYELEAIGRMLSQRVDGLLISACSPQSQEQHAPLVGGVPCVYLGSNHGSACSYVEADHEQGAYQAAQYLYHLGHREITFLGGRRGSRTLEQRIGGYRRSLLANGLTPHELEEPEQAGSLFRRGVVPDAFIAYSDVVAMQLLDAAETHGVRVPEDVSVVGFDDIVFGRLPQIGLTTVSLRIAETGVLAVERLLEKIGGDQRLTADILQPELLVRNTCRRI